ncbi:MAG: hypothetical protein DRI77_12040 [Chloroflexi bacterium]|nr:MAG: hypothetical protein DRI77_12040 [Chloroflexota bacterium]
MTSGWDAVAEFLAASEAMGRVGAALADGAAGRSRGRGAELRTALQDAIARLQRLAHAAGVNLQEAQQETQ